MGKPFDLWMITNTRREADQLVEERVFWVTLSIAQQIGLAQYRATVAPMRGGMSNSCRALKRPVSLIRDRAVEILRWIIAVVAVVTACSGLMVD
ncbi:hypothetical protein [Bradyrhizobium prioriisuperbiae]|uniref:hypothetical protein n=1 Tax=Bradyrhizobium prioriisuperbiae TaxID=2854389 RepID=UPI0028E796F6|nr:hypothetical protein [Bradyrhizobium prioritasuperba]